MTILLQFASLYDLQEVFMWSSCLLDLGTDFLVGNIPSWVTKCSVVQKISFRQTFTNIFNLCCDLDLERCNPTFSQDTPASDAVYY